MEAQQQTAQNLVSVIIPYFNDSDTIERAVASVQNQEYANIEVLIVDDGSSASHKKVITSIAQKDHRVQLITRAQNRGVGFARNTGIAQAKGTYICFLDADDEMYPDKISHQLNVLQNAGADAVLSDYDTSVDGIKNKRNITYAVFGHDGMKLDTAFALRCGIQLVGMLFHRSALEKTGGFRTMYNGQDKDLFIRSMSEGVDWVYSEKFVGVRHTRPDSISANELKVLKRNCNRNIMLLAAHTLKKNNALGSREAQIIAEKVGIEARRWAHYKEWKMAKLRWKQAVEIYPEPKLHGTGLYKWLHKLFGFYFAERIRKLLR